LELDTDDILCIIKASLTTTSGDLRMHDNDLMDVAPIEYVTEAPVPEKCYETDEIETVEQAIAYGRRMGFDISLEEFEGEGYEDPEEAFWEVFYNRVIAVQERCHPVWGW
jgi:hypothetical protein